MDNKPVNRSATHAMFVIDREYGTRDSLDKLKVALDNAGASR